MDLQDRRKLYHRILSSHTDDLFKALKSVKHPDVMLMGSPMKAAQYVERLASPPVLKMLGGAFNKIDEDERKDSTNHNQHEEALHQEIAAQMLGYIPSAMWGQIIKPSLSGADPGELKSVMHHGHFVSNKAMDIVKQKAKKLKSTFRKHPFIKM